MVDNSLAEGFAIGPAAPFALFQDRICAFWFRQAPIVQSLAVARRTDLHGCFEANLTKFIAMRLAMPNR